jgi:hypothetical protein
MVVCKHGEDALRREERGLAVRDLLHRSRNGQAQTTEPLELRAIVFSGSRQQFVWSSLARGHLVTGIIRPRDILVRLLLG